MISNKGTLKFLGKESDISFRNLTQKEEFISSTFYKTYKTPSSNFLRLKLFSAYRKFNNTYPNSPIPSGEIRNLCSTIINSFYNNNRITMSSNFDNMPQNRLEEISYRCKDILKRMFNTNNVILTFDQSQTDNPIKVFLDTVYESYDDLVKDPLNFSMNNNFYVFEKPKNVFISIIISVEYIRKLFNTNYSSVSSLINQIENDDSGITMKNNQQYTFGSDFYLQIDKIVDRFWKDFLSAFTLALYKERYREDFYTKMYSFFSIVSKLEKNKFNFIHYETEEEFNSIVALYKDILEKTGVIENNKSKNEFDYFKPDFYDDVINENREINSVNFIDLYKTLFEPIPHEINTLRAKLDIFKTEDNTLDNYSHLDSTINDLNYNYNDEISNCISTVLILKRLIPFMIFTEVYINNGMKYNEMVSILEKVNSRLSLLINIANATPNISRNMIPMIEMISKDIKLILNNRNVFVNGKLVKVFFNRLYFMKNFVKQEKTDTSLFLNDEVLGAN